jgi:Ankyrin repeats (many copies)
MLPVHVAVARDNLDLVRALAEACSASLLVKNGKGNLALHMACSGAYLQVRERERRWDYSWNTAPMRSGSRARAGGSPCTLRCPGAPRPLSWCACWWSRGPNRFGWRIRRETSHSSSRLPTRRRRWRLFITCLSSAPRSFAGETPCVAADQNLSTPDPSSSDNAPRSHFIPPTRSSNIYTFHSIVFSSFHLLSS